MFLTATDYERLQMRILKFGQKNHRTLQLDIVLLEMQSEKGCGIYVLRHRGQWLPVVFSWKRRTIFTVLPQQALIDRRFEPPVPQSIEEEIAALLNIVRPLRTD